MTTTETTETQLPQPVTRLQFALSQWAVNTANDWDSDEIRQAADMIGSAGKEDDQVRALEAAYEVWMADPLGHNLGEVDTLALVIKFYEEGFSNYDGPQMVDALVSVHEEEHDAIVAGLVLLRDAAGHSTNRQEFEGLTTALNNATADPREAHLWMTNTAPGYDSFWVEGVGYVLYRLS